MSKNKETQGALDDSPKLDNPELLSAEHDTAEDPVANASTASATNAATEVENTPTPVPAPLQSTVSTDDGRYVRFGFIFLLITLGGFSFWAFFAPLSSAVISSGEVMVDSYRKSIQHFEGGVVKEIFVKNGDKVSKGDPLIQLDTVQFEAKRVSNKKRLLTAQAELERLLSEQNFEEKLVFSDYLIQEAKQDIDIQNALDRQHQLHSARLKAFFQERDALRSRIQQTDQQIAGLNKQIDIIKKQITSLQNEQLAFSTLFKEGLGDGQRARELNRSIYSTQNERARLESEVSRLKIQITETDLQIATRKQGYLQEVGERIRKTQNDYYDYQEILQIATDRIDRSTIRSPENGIVVDLQTHTVGSVAPSGQTLLDLVPEHDTFVIESKLMTQDINEVSVGQKVDIRFSAFNSHITKVIEGEVINISADRLLNKRDDSPYYLARIRITEQGAKDMTGDMELKPGMPAEVMILRGERTLFSYLLKPIADSFARSLQEK